MIAVRGMYENGQVTLTEAYTSAKPVRVMVTFLDDTQDVPEGRLYLSDFSFEASRKAFENYQGSFSDALIEDRREAHPGS